MTKPELPEPNAPRHDDLLEDAISWFTGRSKHDDTPEAAAETVHAASTHQPVVEPRDSGLDAPERHTHEGDHGHLHDADRDPDAPVREVVDGAGTAHDVEGRDQHSAPVIDDEPVAGAHDEPVAAAHATPTWRQSPVSPELPEVVSGGATDSADHEGRLHGRDGSDEPTWGGQDGASQVARQPEIASQPDEAAVESRESAAITDSLAADSAADSGEVKEESRATPETAGRADADATVLGDTSHGAGEAESVDKAEAADEVVTSDDSVSTDKAGARRAEAVSAESVLADEDGRTEEVRARRAEAHDGPPEGAIDTEADRNSSEPPSSIFRDQPAAPVAAAAGVGAAGVAAYAATRGKGSDETSVIAADDDPRQRAAEREERDRQLGTVQPLSSAPAVTPHALPTTYKAFPSLGLFLLRIVTAGILGVRAVMHGLDIAAVQKIWADHSMFTAEAPTLAWVQVGLEAAIAVMLFFGLGTRIAGALLAGLAGSLLAFTLWGAGNPFQQGLDGFIGELQVLLAAVGIFFLTTGGGRAAIDGTIHKSRVERKNERLLA